jgi:hypothetical protein
MSNRNDFNYKTIETMIRKQINEHDRELKIQLIEPIYQYIIDTNLENFIETNYPEFVIELFNLLIDKGNTEVWKLSFVPNSPYYASLLSKVTQANAKLQSILDRLDPRSPSPEYLSEKRSKILDKTFFDVYTQDEIKIDDYLHNNEHQKNRPFIISQNGEFQGNYVLPKKEIYYECAPNATSMNPERLKESKPFVKLTGAGGGTILCIKPRWFDLPGHIPKIVRAVKKGTVNQIISKTSQDRPQGARRLVGSDHCDLLQPMDYYKLVPYTEKTKGKKSRTKRARNTRKILKEQEQEQTNITPELTPPPPPMRNNFFTNSLV